MKKHRSLLTGRSTVEDDEGRLVALETHDTRGRLAWHVPCQGLLIVAKDEDARTFTKLPFS